MPGLGLASRVQVTAWQFHRRRNAAALSHHGVRMLYDPEMRRGAAIIIGIVFVFFGVGAMYLLSWFHPAGQVGNSAILADRVSGQVYVMVGGQLHPTNLPSARLIAGQDANPTFVRADEIAKYPQGPQVGIVGVPDSMPIRTPDTSAWTLCDSAPVATPTMSAPPAPIVTLISGPITLGQRSSALAAPAAILASHAGKQYVITDGHRSEIDPADKAISLALGLDAANPPVPISTALFDALPAAEPLVSPVVERSGESSPFDLGPGVLIGSILVLHQPSADSFYVVLADGVQQIGTVVASALRSANPASGGPPVTVAPDKLVKAPTSHALPTGNYPARPLRQVDTAADTTTCVAWSKGSTDRAATITVLSGQGLPIPVDADRDLVHIVKDSTGPQDVEADQVLIGLGAANMVAATGAAATSDSRETLWWVSDQGVRYGVEYDDAVLKALGVATANTRQAPWVLIRTLAPGPELSRADALTQHDSAAGAPLPTGH